MWPGPYIFVHARSFIKLKSFSSNMDIQKQFNLSMYAYIHICVYMHLCKSIVVLSTWPGDNILLLMVVKFIARW